jgi:hypothetical protein
MRLVPPTITAMLPSSAFIDVALWLKARGLSFRRGCRVDKPDH